VGNLDLEETLELVQSSVSIACLWEIPHSDEQLPLMQRALFSLGGARR
jgi:hypothetical protein